MRPYKDRKLDRDRPVQVYRNLHHKCYSVRQGGKVVAHAASITLLDAVFTVSKAGQQKVRDTGVKNVHAWVEGVFVNSGLQAHLDEQVTYNPFKYDTFWSKHWSCPVTNARIVYLDGTGVSAWRINDW